MPATRPIPQDPDKLRLGGAEIGGHQLLVEEGRWYTCNRLEVLLGPTSLFVSLRAQHWLLKFNVGFLKGFCWPAMCFTLLAESCCSMLRHSRPPRSSQCHSVAVIRGSCVQAFPVGRPDVHLKALRLSVWDGLDAHLDLQALSG